MSANKKEQMQWKLHQKIRKSIMKAITTFWMITENDKILLWISGWKDSMLLAKMLCELRDFSHLKFQLKWVYMYEKSLMKCRVDFSNMEKFFDEIWLEVEYVEIKLPSWSKLKEWIWISCQRCSYARRISMFKLCEKRWFNKIALWHHMDDAVTTLFMNMIINRNYSLMPPINTMKKWDITIIRPLSFVREEDIMRLVKKENIPFSPCTCPIWEKSKRKEIKNLVKLMEANYPGCIESIYFANVKKFIEDYKDKNRVTD